ncbi:MAG: phospholipase [Gammaproteobacteria bacterium]|nr:phospholipase [Gammaproteobacteria bacterium]
MNSTHKALLALAALASSHAAQAFTQETHKRIAIDAVNYMKANPATTQYARLAAAASRAGYTIEQFAQVLGQGAYDVDDFADTYLCGAVTGDCQQAPVWGAGASLVKYTSYWHFQNHTRGGDAHGNDIGGYNYSQLTVWGDIDNMAATWLVNDHLDDGPGGMKGSMSWLYGESSKYNCYGVTEANYRHGGYSTKGQYADFQNIPWQPIDNLGQYWYNQFWARPTAQTLGFVLHTTDLLQPHHTWTTSDLNHSGWESWVRDYYDGERLNDPTLVTTALADFAPLNPASSEIRPLLTQGGAFSYAHGGIVLNSTAHADRVGVARQVVPHAIAMVVRLLDHAAMRF